MTDTNEVLIETLTFALQVLLEDKITELQNIVVKNEVIPLVNNFPTERYIITKTKVRFLRELINYLKMLSAGVYPED